MMLVPFTIPNLQTSSHDGRSPLALGAEIGRYSARLRGRVAAFAAISPRHADLLTSFPAAVVAIVARPQSDEARAEAITLVADGEPLSAVARVLGLPSWMRRLPPEAFGQPLPAGIGAPAYDAAFGSRVVATCPPLVGRPDRWMQAVLEACALGDGELALWLGAKRVFSLRRVPPLPVLPLALYAWFSRHPELPASKLMFRPFDPKLGLGRAAMIARHWLMRVLQDMCLAGEAARTPWMETVRIDGFDVVPLTSSSAIIEEGNVMASCVGTYVGYVVVGDCRLYSIRDGALRLATMELRMPDIGSGLPRIVQIKGPRNAPVSDIVSEVAAEWLLSRIKIRGSRATFRGGQHCEKAFEAAVWHPFAARSRSEGGACQPLRPPTVPALMAMLAALRAIERH